MEEKISIELNVNEFNIIMQSLENMPYKAVSNIIFRLSEIAKEHNEKINNKEPKIKLEKNK